jgi:predicted homoserine dehydrogenase-like protein
MAMLYERLQARERAGRPIRIGCHGAGWMGSGFVAATERIPGLAITVLAAADVAAAQAALIAAGVPAAQIRITNDPGQAMDAIRQGYRVVSEDMTLPAQVEAVDVVTDVTASPAAGADVAYAAIRHGKDVVLVNIEADVTVGHVLKKLADEAGVLYSVSSGDEPGCLMELWDYVRVLGFEPIVIGKGKNNPLDPTANPTTVAAAAAAVGKDPYQTASYVDGTKTMFEMACAANATGCVPLRRGMTGPQANPETITALFRLQEDGGTIPFPGVVEFVQGPAMAGGVFITCRMPDARLAADLKYLKVGDGRYSTFFRPYHLWFIEAPLSLAAAHLFRAVTLAPLPRPVAEVMTVAKRDLQPGEYLDGFGGYTFYGLIDRAEAAWAERALPAGLAPGAQVVCPVAAGQIVTWADVRLDETSTVVRLRRMLRADGVHPA